MTVPVIAIDGPTASGKGTVAERVAARLGFHYLDSGALYRLVALAALNCGTSLDDELTLARMAEAISIRFDEGKVWLDGAEVSQAIRAEQVGNAASKAAVLPALRQALLQRQRDFATAPGLVADGRDMGTVVFPAAATKVFLTASVQMRAERRSKQLIEKGFPVNISSLLQDLRERDARDAGRSSAPLKAAEDALVIDSSDLSADEVVELVLAHFKALQAASAR